MRVKNNLWHLIRISKITFSALYKCFISISNEFSLLYQLTCMLELRKFQWYVFDGLYLNQRLNVNTFITRKFDHRLYI